MTSQIFTAAWARAGRRTTQFLLAVVVATLLQAPSVLADDWTQKLPANSPPARTYAAMAYDAARGQVVVFGGLDANFGSLSDTWV